MTPPTRVPALGARVLAATDLSPTADEALRQADACARAHGGALAVMHVLPNVQPVHMLFPQHHVGSELDMADLEGRAGHVLDERVCAVTGRERGAFESFVEIGVDYAAVVARAEAFAASVVVVASQGRTGLARLLLGSVAESVVRYAHCPVLVARPSAKRGVVLCATDLSDPAVPAVRAAAEEARLRQASLFVLHVVDEAEARSASTGEAAREASRAALDDCISRLGVDAKTVVLEGAPGRVVAAYADELQPELVVVGTRGRTGLARVVLGSVAESVVRHAPCSVLAVRLAPPP